MSHHFDTKLAKEDPILEREPPSSALGGRKAFPGGPWTPAVLPILAVRPTVAIRPEQAFHVPLKKEGF